MKSKARAGLPDHEMFNTLNMGIGLVLVVSPKDVPEVEKQIRTGLSHRRDRRRIQRDPVCLRRSRIAVLVSGGGSNLEAILEAQEGGTACRSRSGVWFFPAKPMRMRSSARDSIRLNRRSSNAKPFRATKRFKRRFLSSSGRSRRRMWFVWPGI